MTTKEILRNEEKAKEDLYFKILKKLLQIIKRFKELAMFLVKKITDAVLYVNTSPECKLLVFAVEGVLLPTTNVTHDPSCGRESGTANRSLAQSGMNAGYLM